MTIDRLDEDGFLKRIKAREKGSTKSLLAIENGAVLGRIEYHFYVCLQDGYRMAYVNWLYVDRDHRRRGIGKRLIEEF